MSTSPQNVVNASVITTCFGRNRHLYHLLASLASGSQIPNEVIIVNDDAGAEVLASFGLTVKQIPTTAANGASATFDIGRNRNLGAAAATNEELIFLDVDCLVDHHFIERFFSRLQSKPCALLMGQPRYLTRPLTDDEGGQLKKGQLSREALTQLSVLNPYRFNFPETETAWDNGNFGLKLTDDYGAFWSLCFAIYRSQFDRIGGFDTDYIGYGAEDTDFAFTAKQLGIEFYLTNDVVYHQQHSVYRPPLNHLASIVTNANRFYQKWQHWPMSGWLDDFAQLQLIEWSASQSTPIKIQSAPSKAAIDAAYHPNAPFV